MRRIQYIIQASCLLITVGIINAPALAAAAQTLAPAKPVASVGSIAASLSKTLAVLLPRPLTPADSGILVSFSRSDQADFTVVKSQSETGHEKMSGGKTRGDYGTSLGYRKALSHRWSLDTQFERQRVRRSTSVTADTGNTSDAATQLDKEISETIAHWASVAAVYHASITPKISVHAGGGAFVWQRERKNIGETTTVAKENGTDLLLQLGMGYRVKPKVTIQGSVQRFFIPNKPVDRVSLGLVIQTD